MADALEAHSFTQWRGAREGPARGAPGACVQFADRTPTHDPAPPKVLAPQSATGCGAPETHCVAPRPSLSARAPAQFGR
jgi:hypothetical protein